MPLTVDMLTDIHTTISAHARDTFTRQQALYPEIHGFTAAGRPTIAIAIGEQVQYTDGPLAGSARGLLPGDFQTHAPLIKSWLTRRNVIATVFMAETWMYPEDDTERAAAAYAAGTGPLPSGHPRREDGVMVVTMCPLLGYIRGEQWRVVRRPHRKATVADTPAMSHGTGVDDAESPENMTWMSGWLEELLPAPDDRTAGGQPTATTR